MNINITRLTDDIYEIRLLDESLSSSILLSADEVEGLARIISRYRELSVSDGIGEWYNS